MFRGSHHSRRQCQGVGVLRLPVGVASTLLRMRARAASTNAARAQSEILPPAASLITALSSMLNLIVRLHTFGRSGSSSGLPLRAVLSICGHRLTAYDLCMPASVHL